MAPIDLEAFEALAAPVVVSDREGRIVHWNRACSELLGRALESVRGERVWATLLVPDQVQTAEEAFVNLVSDKRPVRLTHLWVTSRGERILVDCSSLATLGAKGEVTQIVTVGLDITARASEHENTQARLRELLEQAPDGIFVANVDGQYVDVNAAGCRLLQCSRDEIIGKTIFDFIPPGDAERLMGVRERLLEGEIDVDEWRLRRKDGVFVPVEVSAKILADGRWQGFVREITERKAHETERERLFGEIDAERRWLEAVVETVPLAVLLFGPDGTLTSNRRAEELLGMRLSPERGSAQYQGRILFPDGTPISPEQLASHRALHGGDTSVGAEYIVQRPDGSQIPVLGSSAPIRGPKGEIIGGIVVFQDMSERMQSEERIRASERLLNGIFEILPVGLWIADHTGRISRTNPEGLRIWAGARYVGVSEFGEYKGWWADTGKLIEPEDWAVARALTKGETSIGEVIRIQCFDGTFKTIINSALPLHDEQGAFAGAVIVNQDITNLKAIEEELRLAVRSRDAVLGIVAHDLRNPLYGISLALDLLCRRVGGPERRNQRPIEAIRRQVARMNRLIQDLLDVARLDAGALTIRPDRVPADKLVLEAEESQRPIIAAASLDLRTDIQAGLPDLWADRDRLLQVFENLVGNAAKFTNPSGRVTIGAATREHDILFWVADTGAGIPAEHVEHLFDRFWQASRTDRRGAGLGLPIAKGIVEAHGGTMWVESHLGVGTTFYFTIPLARSTDADSRGARDWHERSHSRVAEPQGGP